MLLCAYSFKMTSVVISHDVRVFYGIFESHALCSRHMFMVLRAMPTLPMGYVCLQDLESCAKNKSNYHGNGIYDL